MTFRARLRIHWQLLRLSVSPHDIYCRSCSWPLSTDGIVCAMHLTSTTLCGIVCSNRSWLLSKPGILGLCRLWLLSARDITGSNRSGPFSKPDGSSSFQPRSPPTLDIYRLSRLGGYSSLHKLQRQVLKSEVECVAFKDFVNGVDRYTVKLSFGKPKSSVVVVLA
jgi:hypothetical protein